MLAVIFSYSVASSQTGNAPENTWTSVDFDFQTEINGTDATGAKTISIVDEDIAWLTFADYGNNIGTAPTYQEVGLTTDGGRSWKIIQGPGDPNSQYSNICGIDEKTVWIAVNTSQGGLYRTTDAGANWFKIENTFSSATSLCNFVYFWDEKHGFAQGDPINANGNEDFEMYRTTDGGTTWLKIPGHTAMKNEGGVTDFYDVSENGTLYWQTTQGRIFKTTDKAKSFSVSESGLENTLYGQGLKVLDSTTVIIPKFNPVSKKYTYKITENSGQTWKDWKPYGKDETFGLTYFCNIPGTHALVSVSSESTSTGTTKNFISYCLDGIKGEEWHLFSQWTDEFQEKANAVYVNFKKTNSTLVGYASSYNYGEEDPRLDGILTYKGDMPSITASINNVATGNVSVFPNPASDFIYIINKNKIKSISIADILGKKVKNIKPDKKNISVNISDLNKGIYIISGELENNTTFEKKIIIQ